MSKWKKLVIVAWVILILPSLIYVVVNGYWWLFDGNTINSDKMAWAACVSGVGTICMITVITFPENYP